MKQIEAQAIISATDKTGGVFASIASKIDGLASRGRRVDGLGSQFSALGSHIDGVGRKLDGIHGKMKGIERIGASLKGVAGTMLALGAAHEAKTLGEKAAKAGAEGAHERVRMETAGMTTEEMGEAEAHAAKLTAEFKPISQTTILHLLRNARSIVGTYEEASKILEPLLKLYVVAEGAHPERSAELAEDFDKLVKGLEIKGVTQDLPKFQSYLQGMAKALNVFGDTLRPTDYYEMFKYGRAATTALSEEFMLKTGPTLAQELGGSSTGKALSSFYTQFVGGKMSNKAVEQLLKYGLLDPAKVIKTKTGNVKGVLPGGVVGDGYLTPGHVDPDLWVQKVLLPALAKKGVTDPAQIQEVIAAMASQTTSAQMMSIFATQQGRIEKDWSLVEHAGGLEAADTFMSKDPHIAMKSFTEQFTNLLQAASSPLMQPATDALNRMADTFNHLSEVAKRNPNIGAAGFVGGAAVAGIGAYEATLGALATMGWMSPATAAMFAKAPFAVGTKLALPLSIGGGLYGMRAETEQYEGMTSGQRLALQRGGSMTDVYRRAFGIEPPTIGGEAKVDVNVTISPSDKFSADVRSTVRNEIGNVRVNGVAGTTGQTGKTMPEAGVSP